MMMLPFADPERVAKAAQARAKRALSNAIPYAKFKLPRSPYDVGVIAETFKPENPLADIFPDVEPGDLRKGDKLLLSPDGSLAYSLSVLPRGNGLSITPSPSIYQDDGRVYFTDDVVIPTLLFRRDTSNGAMRAWRPWMSLTPFELKSQASGVGAATGHVVLAGLGMGWLLRQIAAKRTVKSIVVVEKDKNLLDWFGQRLCDETPKVSKVVCADFWDVARDYDKECRFIVDIWPGYGDASWSRRLQALRDDGYRCWAWGSPRGPRR